MKKLLKTVFGLGLLAALGGVIYYLYSQYYKNDSAEDVDDEDYEDYDDLDEEPSSEVRGYTTLDMGEKE